MIVTAPSNAVAPPFRSRSRPGSRPRRLIAIEGGPGSGVTAVAACVHRELGITTVPCPDPRFVDLSWEHPTIANGTRTMLWRAALRCVTEHPHVLDAPGEVLMAGYTVTAMAAFLTDLDPDTADPDEETARLQRHLPPADLTIHLCVSSDEAIRRLDAAENPTPRHRGMVAFRHLLVDRLQAQTRIAAAFPGPVVDTDHRSVEDVADTVTSLICGTGPAPA
ncbi:hypothetical protein [Embleya sp. NPDC059237]|uniref:hypothetical protein n=1 Tax=Embleya sp. NPDC059237 TaxID=3346784 RepID=UPI003674912B